MKEIVIDTYRTTDGRDQYTFSFEEQDDGSWLAFIVTQPDYNGLPDDLHETHRLSASDGRYYVCWTHTLRTIAEAKTVAALWAEQTQKYRAGLAAFEGAS